MGHKSRNHPSKFRGASRHGGGPGAPVGKKEGTRQEPKSYGRFARYPGGAVPQSTRTPEEQLKFLDSRGFTALKERLKLKKRIESPVVVPVKTEKVKKVCPKKNS